MLGVARRKGLVYNGLNLKNVPMSRVWEAIRNRNQYDFCGSCSVYKYPGGWADEKTRKIYSRS
jgi:hypothetical protein